MRLEADEEQPCGLVHLCLYRGLLLFHASQAEGLVKSVIASAFLSTFSARVYGKKGTKVMMVAGEKSHKRTRLNAEEELTSVFMYLIDYKKFYIVLSAAGPT